MSKADAYDFKALGKAIKKAREDKGWTREQVSEMLHLVPRYIQSIENEGQHQSFQVFLRGTLYRYSHIDYTTLYINISFFLFAARLRA